MDVRYRRSANRHELVLSGSRPLPHDSYACRMVRDNQIGSFLPCHIERIDDETLFLYDVTSLQPIEEIFARETLRGALLRRILCALRDALGGVEEYLLPQDGIVLRPDCIFLDGAREQVRFCYQPANERALTESLRALGDYLLPLLEQDDREAIVLGYSFYQLCAKGTLTEQSLCEILYENDSHTQAEKQIAEQEDEVRSRERARILDSFFSDEAGEDAEEGEDEEMQSGWPGRFMILLPALAAAAAFAVGMWRGGVRTGAGGAAAAAALGVMIILKIRKEREDYEQGNEDALGEAVWEDASRQAETMESTSRDLEIECTSWDHAVEKGANDTVLLTHTSIPAQASGAAQLIPLAAKGAAAIRLGAETVCIGKEAAHCEICLPSGTVSRLHARVEWNGTAHLLRDLRSRNGTFLNETILDAGTDYPLQDGDCVRFADVAFHYELC